MRVIRRNTTYASRSDAFRLYILADLHLGNRECREDAVAQIVAEIAQDDHAYWMILGDCCDFINLRDPRRDVDELADWMLGREQMRDIGRAEVKRFLDIFAPIRHKCLAVLSGNHEESYVHHTEADVYSALVEGLADENEHRLDHRGFVQWRFDRQGANHWTYSIYATHGSGSGQSAGAVRGRLKAMYDHVDGADLVLMGHYHQADHAQFSRYRPVGRKVARVTANALAVPALCEEMAYADRKDYGPGAVGYGLVTIWPFRRRAEAQLKSV